MSVFKKVDYRKASKAILGLTLAGVMALGMTGCGGTAKESPYVFNGKIGAETVIYDDDPRENKGILTVQRPNGDTLIFVDLKRDKTLQSFTYRKTAGDSETYERDEVGSAVILAAEKDFRSYLEQIKDIRVDKGLNALKGY